MRFGRGEWYILQMNYNRAERRGFNSEMLYLPLKMSTEIHFPYLIPDFYFYLISSFNFPWHFTL